MDMLDRLEWLARLRETGALTEAEFAAAKALLLAGEPPGPAAPSRAAPPRAAPAGFAPAAPARPVWPWLAGAVVLILVVVAIGLLVGRDVGGAAAGNFTASPDEARVENGAAADLPEPAATPDAPVADYAFASGPGVLGMGAEQLEARLGPAESKAGGRWAYHVGGCAVTYAIRHDAVVAATMPVDVNCHPVVGGTAITERTALGTLAGTYRAACVAECRGATPPVLTLATRDAVYAAADAPLDLWAAALRDDGDAVGDLVEASGGGGGGGGDDPARFTCVADPPASVAAQFAALTVSSVTIGHDPAAACRRRPTPPVSAQP